MVVLVVGYALYGGLAVTRALPWPVMKWWLAALGSFVIGAVLATVVEHRQGPEGMNLRWFWMIVGVAGMGLGVVWLEEFRELAGSR